MISNVGLNYTNNTFFAASEGGRNESEKKQSHEKNHNGKLLLGVLAASAATVGIIALVKKRSSNNLNNSQKIVEQQINDFKKDVFPSLLKLPENVSKEEFTHKAYELMIKSKGLDEVAPKIEIVKIDNANGIRFNCATGQLHFSENAFHYQASRSDVVGLLAHELDHIERMGDIARVLGVEKFTELIKKQAIKKPIQEYKDIVKIAKTLKTKDEIIKNMPKEEKATFFKDGFEKLSREDILAKYDDLVSGTDEEILEKLKPAWSNVFDNTKINKEFWTNYVDKKGSIKPSELNYDIKPFIESFETEQIDFGENVANATSRYAKMKTLDKYLSNPFEAIAWENGIKTRDAWIDTLSKAGKNFVTLVEDKREVNKSFKKVDAYLSSIYPDEAKRAEVFENMAQKMLDKNQVTDNKFKGEQELFDKMFIELQNSTKKGN